MADAIRNQDVLIEPYDRVIGRCYFGNPVPARVIDPDLLYNRSLSSPKHNLVPTELFPEYQTLRRYQLVSEYIPGHVAWNWQTILANGTEGLRRRCEVGLQRRKNDAKSCEFYRGVKQTVVGRDVGIGQLVEQGGLTGIGIAHDGHHGNGVLHAVGSLDAAHLTDLLQLLLQTVDALADMTAVGFQFGLTGAAGADAAALTGQALAHAGQTGQQILVLGQLNLQAAFLGLCPLSKNIQDQRTTVQHGHTQDLFQSPDVAVNIG